MNIFSEQQGGLIVSANSPKATLAWQLAEYVAAARPSDLPDAVRHEATRSFVNWVGCALGGSQDVIARTAAEALCEFSGKPEATLIGGRRKVDALTASLLNCVSSGAHAFDDTHADMVLHPAGPIAAAIMALAERKPVSGADFLLALVLGIEVESRLARAIVVPPAECDVGWYLTGLTGGMGAAVAAGKLMGLSAEQIVWACGIACGEASGFRAMHGSMCSPLVPGHAGYTGLRAAFMAQRGFTSSAHCIEGDRGFLHLFAEKSNPAAITEGLGSRYEVMRNTYKPYPCGIVVHPIIDACLAMRAKHTIDYKAVARVEVKARHVALTLADRLHPTDGMQCKVSIQHWVAVSLVDGAAGIAQMATGRVRAPEIAALRERVSPVADASVAPDAADVTIHMQDGAQWHCRIDHGIGSSDNPMSDRDLDEKFTNLARGVIDEERIAPLITQCWGIGEMANAGEVGRAAG